MTCLLVWIPSNPKQPSTTPHKNVYIHTNDIFFILDGFFVLEKNKTLHLQVVKRLKKMEAEGNGRGTKRMDRTCESMGWTTIHQRK